jgi:hypothetical protein
MPADVLATWACTLSPCVNYRLTVELRQSTVDDMNDFPVPLDNLVSYVKSLHPQADPLDHLSDAMRVSAQVDEQSDALIGYFVDRARHSGASWSQIGASMGVSKQAAQKRFVARDLVPEGGELFSRFTPRSRNALVAAGRIAAEAKSPAVEESHLIAGLLSEPNGIGAKVMHAKGLNDNQVYTAFSVKPGKSDDTPAAVAPHELTYGETGNAVLQGTLKAALRLGHNYIGTEHILLGILFAAGPATQTLASLGLDAKTAESAIVEELARLKQEYSA